MGRRAEKAGPRLRAALLGAVLLSLPACRTNAIGSPAPAAALSEPPVVHSTDGILSLRLAARIEAHRLGPEFSYHIAQAPFWRDGAPTLTVRPGDRISMDYSNALPPILSDEAHGLPDFTNVHFHGLTLSPDSPADDVLAPALRQNRSRRYDLRIEPDQPPGLYWYHPHAHHETSWQVGNGMSGAIVVDGIQDAVPSVAGLRARVLIVREVYTHPEGQAAFDPRKLARVRAHAKEFAMLANWSPAQRIEYLCGHLNLVSENDEKLDANVTVDGAIAGSPVISIAPGERELLRVLNATTKRNLDLTVDGETLDLIAQDGVPVGYLPGTIAVRRLHDVIVPPGGRAEFVVTGSAHSTVLRSLKFDAGPSGDPDPAFALATLADVAAAGGDDNASRLPPARTVVRPHPDYYRTWPAAIAERRTVLLAESAKGTQFSINGRAFDMTDPPMFVARSGTVEEWTLENDSPEVHSFHVHQTHFLLETVGGSTVPRADQHWLDTVNVPYKRRGVRGRVSILVDFRNPVIRGTFVFHCHILDHEDGGMMAKIRVL